MESNLLQVQLDAHIDSAKEKWLELDFAPAECLPDNVLQLGDDICGGLLVGRRRRFWRGYRCIDWSST